MDGNYRTQGLTLLELIIALTILSIVLAAGVPAFTSFTQNQRMNTAVHRLILEINYARSEAIIRRQRVVMCPSSDGLVCLPDPDWHAGRLIFVDGNRNREHDPEELVLRVTAAQEELTMRTPRSRRRAVFYPLGYTPGSNATFTVCDSRGVTAARAVIVSNTGRPRTSSVGPGGRELTCD